MKKLTCLLAEQTFDCPVFYILPLISDILCNLLFSLLFLQSVLYFLSYIKETFFTNLLYGL